MRRSWRGGLGWGCGAPQFWWGQTVAFGPKLGPLDRSHELAGHWCYRLCLLHRLAVTMLGKGAAVLSRADTERPMIAVKSAESPSSFPLHLQPILIASNVLATVMALLRCASNAEPAMCVATSSSDIEDSAICIKRRSSMKTPQSLPLRSLFISTFRLSDPAHQCRMASGR